MKAKNTPPVPDRNSLQAEYERLLPVRNLAVRELETRIEEALASLSSHPRVRGRIKSFSSYFRKYLRNLKSRAKSSGISDIIGVRVICPFLEDLVQVEELLKKHFRVTEVERKGGDHTYREFGYESIHVLILIPDDITKKIGISHDESAEIQIRTILQDAWAEVEHELVYKAEFTPFDDPMKRKLAAVNASLVLADIIFQEIRSYQRELNGQLGQRRKSFFQKIEEYTDAVLLAEQNAAAPEDFSPAQYDGEDTEPLTTVPSNVSIDELLLDALYAHNKNRLSEAIAVYTQILEMNPDDEIRSLIYKHRGMAYFARSHYEDAISDFSESLKLDPKSYKSAYYEGIVCSVMNRYAEALDCFNKSLEINPFQPYCLFRRGQAYYHLEDFPHALSDCEAALALESFEAAQKFKGLVMDKLKM